MTVLVIKNTIDVEIPVGNLMIVENEKCRLFDPLTDDVKDIVGACYPIINQSGRAWSQLDGPQFYLDDSILWNEDLTWTADEFGSPISNENYTGFNPVLFRNSFTSIAVDGMVAVLKTSENDVPSSWKKLRQGTTYDWWLIH
jgi:hypothetical protein